MKIAKSSTSSGKRSFSVCGCTKNYSNLFWMNLDLQLYLPWKCNSRTIYDLLQLNFMRVRVSVIIKRMSLKCIVLALADGAIQNKLIPVASVMKFRSKYKKRWHIRLFPSISSLHSVGLINMCHHSFHLKL